MKMAARMSCNLPSQTHKDENVSYMKASRKDGRSKNGGDCREKCPAGVSERPCKAIKVYGLELLKTYKLC